MKLGRFPFPGMQCHSRKFVFVNISITGLDQNESWYKHAIQDGFVNNNKLPQVIYHYFEYNWPLLAIAATAKVAIHT